MLARIRSGAVWGVDAIDIEVEVDVSPGLPQTTTVGLPDGAVRESRDRIRAAIRNAGFSYPQRRVTVNLAPAGIRKEGSSFDLPIALGVLAAAAAPPLPDLGACCALGELGLDGRILGIRGALSIARAAGRTGATAILVPEANAAEAALAGGPPVFGVATLEDAVAHLRGERRREPTMTDGPRLLTAVPRSGDIGDVRGQAHAKRALEIAAGGGHNLVFIGPPGSGKTMLATRLPSILPPLTLDEAIEVTAIHSVAGLLGDRPLVTERPVRAPHSTISDAALLGGGAPARPGELSLAHRGVLFLDELPEFRRHVLEPLRQPLEARRITIARGRATVTLPTDVLLVAAMNPCPCGHLGADDDRCRCTPTVLGRYRARVSGPLLDRIDLHVEMPRVPTDVLVAPPSDVDDTTTIRRRVAAARARQADRLGPGRLNVHLRGREVHRAVRPEPAALRLLAVATDRLGLSARAHTAVLRVARTIADLEASERVGTGHMAEAIQFRSLDRTLAP